MTFNKNSIRFYRNAEKNKKSGLTPAFFISPATIATPGVAMVF